MRAPSIITFAVLSLAAIACAPKNTGGTGTTADADSQALADDGTDTSNAEGDGVSLTGTLIASSGTTLSLASESGSDGDLHFDNVVGGGSRELFMPLGCLTVTNPDATSVLYSFNACNHLGLRTITGDLKVVYATSGGALTLTGTSENLVVNGATLSWSVNASIVANGAMRTMTWSAHFAGTTRGGRAIERDNDKTVTWTVGDSCTEINGTSRGNVTGKDLQTKLIGYKRCKDACPEAGSEIQITRESTGKLVDLTYGDDDATFTDAKGDMVTFTPLCALL